MYYIKKSITIIILQILFVNQSITQNIELSLEQLCQNSKAVIIAETKSFYSYQSFDKKRVYTDITIEVKSSLKGDIKPNEKIKITYYGGTINGITTAVIGSPTFKKNQISILFLTEKKEFSPGYHFYRIVGDSQGKFNVNSTIIGERKTVKREQINMPLKLNDTSERVKMDADQNIEFDSFISLIKSFINK